MQTRTLKNLPGMKEGDEVIIWRMNNGFKSDMQGQVTDIHINEDHGKVKTQMVMNPAKMRIYMLVYGIWEAKFLNINAPKNADDELNPSEFEHRKKIVRAMEPTLADEIFNAVTELNAASPDYEVVEKKSDSQPMANSSPTQER